MSALAMVATLPDNRPVNGCGLVRRLVACVAIVSLFGWLELPSEHIHTSFDGGHAVESVHRHFAAHVPDSVDDHDHASVDHEDEAVYLTAQAAEVSQPVISAPQGLSVSVLPMVIAPAPIRVWLAPRLPVHVHAPPWGRLYARRGPPAFAV